jgi:hypothetical protein
MKPRQETNGHHGTWEAWSARAGKALARGPLSLAEAQAAFNSAPAEDLAADEIDVICQAGVALYGETVEPASNGSSSRGTHRNVPHHWLLHERLDRRELPTSLTMFACPLEVIEMSTQFTPAADAPAAEAPCSTERHFVERAAWKGTNDWTPQDDPSADTGIAAQEVDWQDTLELESHLAFAGVATALAANSADVMHEAVFSHDNWLEAV